MKSVFCLALLAHVSLCSAATLRQSALPDFDHLRQSVVRIQAVSTSFDWFHPFVPGNDGVGVGTGWVVQTDPYPLFVTNEHVINDAKQVSLQLLLYGEQQWEADVVSVCSKFDLSLLVLRQPEEFKKAMAKRNIKLEALKLSDKLAPMGADVVALGFPLGQDALKISKGNIAGNEEVNDNICIQSTAPISPGNSGGPLMNAAGTEVVGVNFAKATHGENINYVIPVWRVRQLVNQHLHDQPEVPKDGTWKRIQVKVPKAELTATEANEALYELSEGCTQGIYNAKIGQRSFLRHAEPAVEQGSFLVSVNGFELDRFGMGLNPDYAADRVHFKDLFFMVPELSSGVKFATCFKGKVTEHKVSMDWKPDYGRGLQWVDEPNMLGLNNDYEMFGDISVMQMTVNHISHAVSKLGNPGPARWLHPDLVSQQRLVVNYVRSGSYAADILPLGAAVTKVNGHEVHTLEDFRKYFVPDNKKKVWTMETDMGKVIALMFDKSLSEQLKKADMMNAPYLLTPSVVNAAKTLGLTQRAGEDTLGSPMHAKAKKNVFLTSSAAVSTASLPVRAAGPVEVQKLSEEQPGRATVRADGAILTLSA
jgi:S1-C subfamily serine protease